jgi:hypothetical protein
MTRPSREQPADLEAREITLRQFMESTSKNTLNPVRMDLFQDEDKENQDEEIRRGRRRKEMIVILNLNSREID